ncbi:hypothetical protein ECBG_02236 [Enterococcus casseliflavus EC20]|uniref:Mga helix-turn-helix domain-containing protein n=1 Tax=Enterococcus casseliflavus EC20 TaxID=565655 RepID=C9A5R3_ENTCA|nr:helix-turn-helix domain-containing protein [Enterococcus casseliflavus]EEV39967.2 hypothetical protein ECBG_02236 [Enterococcus casseliflavus EC20]
MNTFSSQYLTRKQNEKLKIFSVLVAERYISLKKLSESLETTMYQTKVLLLGLKEDIEQLDSDTSPLFFQEKGTIELNKEYNQEVLLNVFVKLKKVYFDESPYFRLLNYLLKYRKTRVIDISKNLMFSKSYSYKLISRLKDIFKFQQIPITIHSDFESISLKGNEKHIRTYHYLVQVMAYNVFADRHTRVNIDLVGENYKSLQTTKVKHEILFSILENAVSRGYIVHDLDRKTLDIFNIMRESYEDTALTKLLPTNRSEEMDKEVAFFYFCRQLLIPETTSIKDKVSISERFKLIENNSIVNFSIDVIKKISKKYNLNYEVEHIIMYETIINTWAYQNIYFEDLNRVFSQQSSDSRISSIRNIIFEIVSNTDLEIANKELFADKIANILVYFLPIQMDETVVIAISMLNYPEYVPVIQNKLLTIFNKKVINFSSIYEDADILVSDGVLCHDEYQDFAFFSDIHNKGHWDNLNSVVQKRIISKLG